MSQIFERTNNMENEKKSVKKVLGIIGNVLIWLFVAFSVVVTILAFAAQANSDGIPTIGGTAILTVDSDSMAPTFYKGDIIVSRKLTTEEKASLNVQDVITFKYDINGNGRVEEKEFNTHRIIEVVKNEDGSLNHYVTKGDNKVDNRFDKTENVTPDDIVCIYKGKCIKKLGSVLEYLQTKNGFLLVIVLPLLAFFIYELIRFIRKFMQVKNADKRQITAEEEELIKQRAVEEYLRSQQQQQSGGENNAPAEPEKQPEEKPDLPQDQKTAESAEVPENSEAPEEPAEEADPEEKKPE